MELLKKFGGIMATLVVASLLLTGCFREQAATGPAVEQSTPDVAKEEWIQYAIERSGNALSNREISIFVDPETGDTSVVFGTRVDAAAKAKGIRGTSVALKKSVVQRMMVRRDSTAPAIGKRSQTRWSASFFDVKALTEVHQIKVYFEVYGGSKMKPGWLAAARDAMVRWNNLPGTHVSFIETSSPTNNDLIVKCAVNDLGYGSTTWLTPDPWVEKDSVEIYFNGGYESLMTHDQKLSFALMAFGNILNITFTEAEGGTWVGGGVFLNIAGTPTSDPLSVFQSWVGPNANTAFSENDIRAIQQLYPVWGNLARNNSNDLISAGWEGPVVIASNVTAFETEGDTLYFLKTDGSLWRRIGPMGSNVTLWGAGYGALSSFTVSEGWVAAQKASNGSIHTRRVTHTSWFEHNAPPGSSGFPKYRLTGGRLAVAYPSHHDVYSRYCDTENNGHAWHLELNGTNIVDFQIVNNRLFVNDDGELHVKDEYGTWMTLWYRTAGRVEKIYVSNLVTGISVNKGPSYSYFDTYYSNELEGNWNLFANPTSLNAVDVCEDKFAAANYDGTLYIQNVSTGTGYSHSPISEDWGSTQVRVSGSMCDHVTRVGEASELWAKYSVTTSTGYLSYGSNFAAQGLMQRP